MGPLDLGIPTNFGGRRPTFWRPEADLLGGLGWWSAPRRIDSGQMVVIAFGTPITYKNSRILFSFFSGGLRPPHPPDKSAFGLPRRVRNSWYHGTMVPWYHGSVVGMVPMVPMVHVVAWYRGTMVPMVWGYHGTRYHLT